jgi:16S rRNA (cytosine967-C5)-methyltransferase
VTSDARLAAVRVLLDVAAGRRADSSLDKRARDLSPADRALCQEIAFGTLRRKAVLDHRLDSLLKKGLGSLPLTVQAILEVAGYQILFLERVPSRAAIHEAVKAVRALLPPDQARGLSGVVNASLRALATQPRATVTADGLALETSHPAWLVSRWVERFGPTLARAILTADNERPSVHLRPHAGRISASELVDRLMEEGAEASPHPLFPECVVLKGGDPRRLAAFREGLFAIQDVSAQMVSRLLPRIRGGLFLDACAAPGGKIGAAAERPDGATFLATDVSRTRLSRLLETARRQRLPIHTLVADARNLALRRRPDVVLVDAPCLGTGTLRRRVDARWQISPDRLPELLDLQRGILSNAAGLLAPGGFLLYATCSLEPEENEQMAGWLLETRADLRLVDLGTRLPSELSSQVEGRSGKALFITPADGECDGAFAALMEKVA